MWVPKMFEVCFNTHIFFVIFRNQISVTYYAIKWDDPVMDDEENQGEVNQETEQSQAAIAQEPMDANVENENPVCKQKDLTETTTEQSMAVD